MRNQFFGYGLLCGLTNSFIFCPRKTPAVHGNMFILWINWPPCLLWTFVSLQSRGEKSWTLGGEDTDWNIWFIGKRQTWSHYENQQVTSTPSVSFNVPSTIALQNRTNMTDFPFKLCCSQVKQRLFSKVSCSQRSRGDGVSSPIFLLSDAEKGEDILESEGEVFDFWPRKKCKFSSWNPPIGRGRSRKISKRGIFYQFLSLNRLKYMGKHKVATVQLQG